MNRWAALVARSRSARRESGAVLIEAAFGMMLLMIICSGIVEYANLFASTIDISSATRSAARTGAMVTVDGPMSDYRIVQSALQKSGTKRSSVERVIVYKADRNDGQIQPSCFKPGGSAKGRNCNIYEGKDFELGEAAFNALPEGQGWPVAEREPGVDYIGVKIDAKRDSLLKLVSAPQQFTDSTAMRLSFAPRVYSGSGWMPAAPGEYPGWGGQDWTCWDDRGCEPVEPDDGGGGGGGGGPGKVGGNKGGSG